MSQTALPALADITVGNWTPLPLWKQLNEVIPLDDHKVVSSVNPVSDTFEVRLDKLAKPDKGPQILTVRLRQTGTSTIIVRVWLVQGTTIIASRTIAQPALSFTSYPYTLTEQEKALISDYHDLRVRVQAGMSVVTGCSQVSPAAQTWTFTLSGISCGNFNQSYSLTYVSACVWRQSFFWGQATLQFISGNWQLTLTAGGSANATYTTAPANWNGVDCNTMNYSSSGTQCTGWPATLQVCPG